MIRIRHHRSVFMAVAVLVATVVTLMMAPEAMAQFSQESKSPPTPSSSGNPPVLIQYGVLVVLTLGVVGLGIFKSKREVRN